MNEFLEPETYRKIYNLISENSGIHSRRIAEMLNMNISSVEEYLDSMLKNEQIFSLKQNGYDKYYTRKRKGKGTRDKKTHDIRDKIIQLLSETPGIHLSKIAEELDMSVPLARYHLRYLERKNLTVGIREKRGYYKRFYVKDSEVGVKDKQIVSLLRQEQLLKIVVYVLENPHIQHKKLSEYVGIHPSTLTHHIIRLDEYGIIDVITYGNKKGYLIKNRKEIIRIIRNYVTESKIERFKGIWDDFSLN